MSVLFSGGSDSPRDTGAGDSTVSCGLRNNHVVCACHYKFSGDERV